MNILSIFLVLRRGYALKDPAAWKDRAQATYAVAGLIATVIHALEYYDAMPKGITITSGQVDFVAGVIVTVVAMYFNYATSDKVGFGKAPPAEVTPAPYVVPEYAGAGSEQAAQPAETVVAPAGPAVLHTKPQSDSEVEQYMRAGG